MRLSWTKHALGMSGRNFVAVSEFLMIGGVALPLLLLPGATSGLDLSEGLPVFQVVLAGLHLLSLFFLVKRFWGLAPKNLFRALALPVLFIAFAMVSSTWSELPGVALRRSVALAGTTALAAFIVFVIGFSRAIRLFFWSMVIAAALSIIFVVLLPELGIHQSGSHTGSWRGAYLHKNLLGREMAIGLTVAAVLASGAKRSITRGYFMLLGGVMALLMLFSTSATGIVAGLAGLMVVGTAAAWHNRPLLKVSALICISSAAVALSLLLAVAPDLVFGALGRDATLTGRTQLWTEVGKEIVARPLTGSGYGTFWNTTGGVAISDKLGWRVTHAHNGYLDVALQIGLPGLLIVTSLILRPLYLIVRYRRRFEPTERRFFGSLLVVTLVVAISDSVLLGPNNTFMTLLLISFMGIEHAWLRSRRVEPVAAKPVQRHSSSVPALEANTNSL